MKTDYRNLHTIAAALAFCAFAPGAVAQNFSVNFSNQALLPASFGAAGAPGAWNSVSPRSGPNSSLVNTSGNPTGTSIEFVTSAFITTLADPNLAGDTAALLTDGFPASDVVEALRVEGLSAGTYDLTLYGFVPGSPASSTFFLMPFGVPVVGGTYAGSFEEGITHGLAQVVVDASGSLQIEWGSGFFGGIGFFSGFQLERVDFAANYCTSTPNSSGGAAVIEVSGSPSIADGSLVLSAGPVPNEPFLFYAGPNAIAVPFGDGVRCVGGTTVRLGAPTTATGNLAARILDPASFGLTPGTWNVQCWFRDPAAMGAGFNLSDGAAVALVP